MTAGRRIPEFCIRRERLSSAQRIRFDNPGCYLIIGYDLSEKQLRKIRTKERLNPTIKVRTYDNLIEWAENIIKFVKKHNSRK